MKDTPAPHCGTDTHGDGCLCDVVITEPCKVHYNFGDVHLADIVARALGVDANDLPNRSEAARFMSALGNAHDAVQRLKKVTTVDHPKLRPRLVALLQQGHSIVDAPELMELEWGDVMRVFTAGNVTTVWGWSPDKWLLAESLMQDSAPLEDCLVILELPATTASEKVLRNVWKTYGHTIKSRSTHRAEQIRRFIIDNACQPLKQLRALLAAEGFTMSEEVLYSTRRKLEWQGKVPPLASSRPHHSAGNMVVA